jgi:hypothetical protein
MFSIKNFIVLTWKKIFLMCFLNEMSNNNGIILLLIYRNATLLGLWFIDFVGSRQDNIIAK